MMYCAEMMIEMMMVFAARISRRRTNSSATRQSNWTKVRRRESCLYNRGPNLFWPSGLVIGAIWCPAGVLRGGSLLLRVAYSILARSRPTGSTACCWCWYPSWLTTKLYCTWWTFMVNGNEWYFSLWQYPRVLTTGCKLISFLPLIDGQRQEL